MLDFKDTKVILSLKNTYHVCNPEEMCRNIYFHFTIKFDCTFISYQHGLEVEMADSSFHFAFLMRIGFL